MLGSARDDEHGRSLATPTETGGMETGSRYVFDSNIDLVYARAVAAGAEIIRPLHLTDHGSRDFALKDPEGYTWWIGNYDPWAEPEG